MTLNFLPLIIHILMLFVKSTSFLVMVNGESRGLILPSRGLTQGDPLSPYLFILCTKSLVSLLKFAASNGSLKGIRVCCGAPGINHLFFVNNSHVFYKAGKTSSLKSMRLVQGNALIWQNNNGF